MRASDSGSISTYSAVLHLHTWRCKHASGDASAYVATAVAGGCLIAGMSDHAPTLDGRWIDHRMALVQLDDYENAIHQARLANPRATVLMALECEFVEEFAAFHRDLLTTRGYDYLVLGQHFAPHQGRWLNCFSETRSPITLKAYAAALIRGMESGLYAFVAHPDIFGCGGTLWGPDQVACAEEICAASARLGVPLELNAYGLRKPFVNADDGPRPMYPWLPFWTIAARHGCQVVLSSDAHRPQDTLAGFVEINAMRKHFGLNEATLAPQLVARHQLRVKAT